MKEKLDLARINKVFFIGIGGIGMSALARFFNEKGKKVFGYDKVETELTRKLVDEGIKIHYDDNSIWIPSGIDLVVFTPAIPDDHSQLNWFLENEFPVFKRSEILGLLSEQFKTIAVAGTHGKTSTSAIIAHILKYANKAPNVFLGGILVNYDSNYFGGASDWMVAEADEYDRSFLKLSPNILVINSMDPDHLDIYSDYNSMIDAYLSLVDKIEEAGVLIIRHDLLKHFDQDILKRLADKKIRLYLFGGKEEIGYRNAKVVNGQYVFDYVLGDWQIKELVSVMPGRHNIENAVAAITVASLFDLRANEIQGAMSSFKGIKRRFEWVYNKDFVLIDDYAHHPEELKAAIETALEIGEGRKITVIFQAHLYTRTRDFYKGFAKELSRVDEVLLMPIYPAREEPIEGITSQIIFDLLEVKEKALVDSDSLISELCKRKHEFIMTLGAADLDKYHKKIIIALAKNE